MGLVKLGTIAVDGIKIKANASRHKAMSYERMVKAEAELKAQIKTLLDKAKTADEAEKNEPELDIPAEIARRQDRLQEIAAARARLESRQREADIEAVKANLDADASQVLADAGYRSEAVFEQLKDHPTELVVALGREGKEQVEKDALAEDAAALVENLGLGPVHMVGNSGHSTSLEAAGAVNGPLAAHLYTRRRNEPRAAAGRCQPHDRPG